MRPVWRLRLSIPALLVNYAGPVSGTSLCLANHRVAPRLNRPPAHLLLLPAALGLAFLLFLLPLPHGWSAGWRGELTNRVHAPLMGVCFLLFATLLRRPLLALPPLALATTAALLMAALVEGVQPWFGRTASLEDFLWGVAGIFGGLAWSCARPRVMMRLLGLACMLGPPLLWWGHMALIQAQAARLLPVLVDESHPHLHPLWSIDSLHISQGPAPVVLERDATHPASIHLDALERDWSSYAGLEISGTLQADAAVEVGVRVDLDDAPANRLRAGGWMQPGTGQIRVLWTEGAATPQVHQLVVFLAAHPDHARLQIHQLRLLPKAAAPASTRSAPATTKKTPSAGLQGTGADP